MADEYDLEELIERPYRKREEKYGHISYEGYEEAYAAPRPAHEDFLQGSEEEEEEEEERVRRHKHKRAHKKKKKHRQHAKEDDGGFEVRQEEYSEVRQDGCSKVRQDGYSKVRQDGYSKVRQDGCSKVRQEGGFDVRQDGGFDVRQDGYNEVRQDGYSEVRQDGYSKVRQDGYSEVRRPHHTGHSHFEDQFEEHHMHTHRRHRHRHSPSESPPGHHRIGTPHRIAISSRQSEEAPRDRSRERRSREGKARERERRSREERRRREEGSSEERSKSPELTTEEKDARTIFCMQLSTRLRPIDLKEFFGKLGKIRDVRLIMDNRSRRSKGIAYIEFQQLQTVAKAMSLNGQKLLGVPIIIQPSHGDRNRSNLPITTATGKPGQTGPMKLYVGSLHYNISEDMLRTLFEPFGPLDELKLMKDQVTGKSAGYGFLQYRRYDDAKKALEQLNGYEIAGRPMKLGSVAEYQLSHGSSKLFDADEVDKVGFGMSATSRIQLMAKLAEGTGFEIPEAAARVLQEDTAPPPIATQCFLLANMFTANEKKDAEWEGELREEVLEECGRHGGALHIHIDKTSAQGHIYIKCPTIASAMASVNTLHGRFFAGRQITASYVPLPSYHNLFPLCVKNSQLLQASTT